MDLTIMMTSCNAYRDILDIHDILFKKNWKDCPFEKILVVDKFEEGKGDCIWDEIVEAGEKAEGANGVLRLIKGLDQIKSTYVLLLQEDSLLYDCVDTKLILEILNLAKKYDAGNIRLVINPKTDVVFSKEEQLLEYPKGMAYRIAIQPGIWKTDFLRKLVAGYMSPADIERDGSFKSCKYKEPVLCYSKCAYPYINAIQRGKWQSYAIDILSWNGISPNFEKHPVMSDKEKLVNDLKGYILAKNPELVTKIQNKIRIGKRY